MAVNVLRWGYRLTVFENRVMRILHYEELYDLHSSLNIIRVIKSEGM